jgi:hypothetical protein
MYQRERKLAGAESLFSQAQQTQRILAAGKEQGRVGTLACDFAHDMDGFGFEPIEM